ncbi:hypothetical protein COU58_01670 [Candidatus Pacearchaeota archaeon CG10_big_fil_rev_8_21_14_0_10_32_42]|nr:MAG: hypothetical protein COU58_01670 [Candidatus Pacearchaeota archaeon CG10_big_fil_rev_8_21_14_0_10_32_42]
MKNKKGAMEMSVGTIVTIVLLMSVLVLGLFFVQRIFSSGSNAIDSIDSQVQNEINQLFGDGTKRLSVYPTSREISVKRGDKTPKGFAFSVRNDNNEPSSSFEYSIETESLNGCGQTMTKQLADSYILGGSGTFTLGPSSYLENARLVRFSFPESSPACTIYYKLEIMRNDVSYSDAQVIVTIK